MYIIKHEVAVYHQCKALYIIITEFLYTLKRDDMQKRAKKSLFLMICTQTSCMMICQTCGLDKKRTKLLLRSFLVGRDGFEPSKSVTTDLQSAPFGHSGTSPYGAGDWNRTHNLLITSQLLCLVELRQHINFLLWCLGAESNHRHGDFQSPALPTELPRHNKLHILTFIA